jgi:hypothetical protein
MDGRALPYSLKGWIIAFIFGTQEFIHHSSLSGEYKRSSSKYRDALNMPQNETAIFSKVIPKIFITLKKCIETIPQNKSA